MILSFIAIILSIIESQVLLLLLALTLSFPGSSGPNPFVTFNNGDLLGITADFPSVGGGATVKDGEFVQLNNQTITDSFQVRRYPDGGPILQRVGTLSGDVQYSLQSGETTSVPEAGTTLGTCLFVGLAGLTAGLRAGVEGRVWGVRKPHG